MVEQSTEVASVIGSNPISGIIDMLKFGKQVSLRTKWLKTLRVRVLSPIICCRLIGKS
jgi:hypothetical protein